MTVETEVNKLVSISSWFISFQIITLVAFLGATGLLYKELGSLKQQVAGNAAAGAGQAAPKDVENYAEYIREHNATLGSDSAKVVIEEYTDFQCPFCKTFNERVRSDLVAKFGDRVRLVFKHYPLEAIHPQAKPAAVAAQCALREGKFWEIKDSLFGNQEKLSPEYFIEAGKSLGLGERYIACVTNQETLAEVEQDIEDGRSAGIQGTPTFLINGKPAMGAVPVSQFDSIIQRL